MKSFQGSPMFRVRDDKGFFLGKLVYPIPDAFHVFSSRNPGVNGENTQTVFIIII